MRRSIENPASEASTTKALMPCGADGPVGAHVDPPRCAQTHSKNRQSRRSRSRSWRPRAGSDPPGARARQVIAATSEPACGSDSAKAAIASPARDQRQVARLRGTRCRRARSRRCRAPASRRRNRPIRRGRRASRGSGKWPARRSPAARRRIPAARSSGSSRLPPVARPAPGIGHRSPPAHSSCRRDSSAARGPVRSPGPPSDRCAASKKGSASSSS